MDTHTEITWDDITPNISIGSNMCCATHEDRLKNEGFDVDIDLELERAELPPLIPVYLWLPTTDHTAPTQDQLEAGVALLQNVIGRGKRAYVHCMKGHGRSPTLVAAYFVASGMDVKDAIETIRKERPAIHIESVQVDALREFLDHHR